MVVIRRAKYRIWQFWRSIWQAQLTVEDEEAISSVLNDRELVLFQRQTLQDKHHCLQVLRTLKKSGHKNEDLLVAALLHDVGKTRSKMTRWDRSLVVLSEGVAPSLAERWAQGSGSGWSRPYVIKAKHAEWGAEEAAAAGSSELTVELIRRHHENLRSMEKLIVDYSADLADSDPERLLALLQRADGIN